MAVYGPKRIDAWQFFFGLSTDTKPTAGVQFGDMFCETDTVVTYRYLPSGWTQYIEPSYDATARAGERQQNSETGLDHTCVAGEWAISSAIDLSNNASTTVYEGRALLGGIWVEVTLASAAATIDDDATAKLTVPIALPIGYHALPGIIFETSLIVNPADATTGTIRVLYRPLDSAVVWA